MATVRDYLIMGSGTAASLGVAVALLNVVVNLREKPAGRNLEMVVQDSGQQSPLEELPSVRYHISNPAVAQVVDNLVELKTPRGPGSGFFTDPLTIVTAYHVLADVNNQIATPITIIYHGQEFEATGVRFKGFPEADVARLEFDQPVASAHTLLVYNSPLITTGEYVQMVGFRLGEFSNSFGSISSTAFVRCYTYINTDIKVRKGNSGSPIIDGNTGAIIGVASSALFSNADDVDSYAASGNATISFIGNVGRTCSR